MVAPAIDERTVDLIVGPLGRSHYYLEVWRASLHDNVWHVAYVGHYHTLAESRLRALAAGPGSYQITDARGNLIEAIEA